MESLLWIGVLLVSAVLTACLRSYARRARLIDVPNSRSSHVVPTPRGGGLAIVISLLLAWAVLAGLGRLPWAVLLGAGLGGGWIALIGFIDDHRDVSARWRLLGQALATVWVLYWLPVAAVPLGDWWLEASWLVLLAGIGIVWLLNLFNFMDGIDGLAGLEAAMVAAGAVLLQWSLGEAQGMAWASAMLVAAAAGFLLWNWPPARIFMGDVGSATLGYLFGVMAVSGVFAPALSVWSWLILLGVFIVDATYTLIHRLLRGERVYQAHRSHAYQRAARWLGSHRRVTVTVGLINALWLLPLAAMSVLWPGQAYALTAMAYLPLVGLCLWLGAGKPERSPVGAVGEP
ncbi:glycosyltransferase family 4 protein [Alkalilimnicola sp. S0819]|nr:glycosyltransferase family 4 protein [Alkalilimnicola sp. S0819]KAB7628253.1 glycosyltransferase family 4 protein [Alkalilimnicola sp. S0819]MPQ15144.1 glycosyl transferase [Alkalilimnicola sp. S0819]